MPTPNHALNALQSYLCYSCYSSLFPLRVPWNRGLNDTISVCSPPQLVHSQDELRRARMRMEILEMVRACVRVCECTCVCVQTYRILQMICVLVCMCVCVCVCVVCVFVCSHRVHTPLHFPLLRSPFEAFLAFLRVNATHAQRLAMHACVFVCSCA